MVDVGRGGGRQKGMDRREVVSEGGLPLFAFFWVLFFSRCRCLNGC